MFMFIASEWVRERMMNTYGNLKLKKKKTKIKEKGTSKKAGSLDSDHPEHMCNVVVMHYRKYTIYKRTAEITRHT